MQPVKCEDGSRERRCHKRVALKSPLATCLLTAGDCRDHMESADCLENMAKCSA